MGNGSHDDRTHSKFFFTWSRFFRRNGGHAVRRRPSSPASGTYSYLQRGHYLSPHGNAFWTSAALIAA